MNNNIFTKVMKKHFKKTVATVLSLALVIGSLNGLQVVKAAENTDFQMRAGASIRTNANSGIRFAVEITGDVKSTLFNDNNTLKEDAQVGMIVVPKQILDSISNTDGVDYLAAIKDKYGKNKNEIATIFDNSQFKIESGKLVATGAIVNIKEVNFTREYQAVAFYSTDNGESYTYTAKSDARSIGRVADRALNDTTDYTSDKAVVIGDLLSKYIVVKRNNDLSYELLNGQTINLDETYANGLVHDGQFEYSVRNNADNVSISENNVLRAEKEGNATVIMKAYGSLVNMELPIITGKNYKASFTAANAFYSADYNTKATIYTREQIDSYEGSIPLTIGGRVAQLKASLTFTEDEWNNGGQLVFILSLI